MQEVTYIIFLTLSCQLWFGGRLPGSFVLGDMSGEKCMFTLSSLEVPASAHAVAAAAAAVDTDE